MGTVEGRKPPGKMGAGPAARRVGPRTSPGPPHTQKSPSRGARTLSGRKLWDSVRSTASSLAWVRAPWSPMTPSATPPSLLGLTASLPLAYWLVPPSRLAPAFARASLSSRQPNCRPQGLCTVVLPCPSYHLRTGAPQPSWTVALNEGGRPQRPQTLGQRGWWAGVAPG